MITQYKALIGWRYEQLMAMERDAADTYQMYIKEYEKFFKTQRGREWFGFSRLEIWLPRLFLGLDVTQSLEQNRRVIVLAGSGRLADELASGRPSSPLITVVDISTESFGLRSALATVLEGLGNDQL